MMEREEKQGDVDKTLRVRQCVVDKTLRVRQCLKKRQVQVCFTPFPFEGAAMLITPFHGKRFLFFSGKGERGGGVIFVNKVLL